MRRIRQNAILHKSPDSGQNCLRRRFGIAQPVICVCIRAFADPRQRQNLQLLRARSNNRRGTLAFLRSQRLAEHHQVDLMIFEGLDQGRKMRPGINLKAAALKKLTAGFEELGIASQKKHRRVKRNRIASMSVERIALPSLNRNRDKFCRIANRTSTLICVLSGERIAK